MATNDPVIVVATGAANIASVAAALERAGVGVRFSDDRAEIGRARRLVLPGVGAFQKVMARLEELELVESLRERVSAGRPTLAICLGLQVLASASEELALLEQDAMVAIPYDLLSVRLETACDILSGITGEITSNEILNSIFDSFCIGK